MRKLLVLVALFLALWTAAAAAEEPLFPFVISYDCPDNVTNVSGWLERPAGKHGFVRAEQGRLATSAGPIRFWATNMCFDACFPPHQQAERLAARLARLGINCVRMHHMDARSIWGDMPNKLTPDPKRLERLDYLLYQFKLHGIYANLNLHVSRSFGEAEGFAAREGRPDYDKGLDNFEPRMIELQKKYARDLLTHVNQYTRTPYTKEPAIAFVEISNEDALYAVWGWGKLDDLAEPYAGTFRKYWNAWLVKKYGTTAKLRQAWNVGAAPLEAELLKNGDFAQPPESAWHMEKDAKTEARWSVEPADGRRALRLVVVRQGEIAWHPQLTQAKLALKKDQPYTLAFRMRSDKKRKTSVNAMMAHAPWERLGLAADVRLDSQWRAFRFTFLATRDDDNARISFSSFEPGEYELAEVSLKPGGIAGLEPGQTLEEQTVPVLRHGEMHLTRTARQDFAEFLWDTERDYWWGMQRFIKEELGAQSLVAGTQIGYSPAHVQAGLDYVDAHSYYNHPHFPGRPWDPQNWYVDNTALVNSPGGTLARLAATRVAGMPFTVSEYNHPQPIQYAAEGFPMIAAFGAFQGWDAVYSFAYSHNTTFEPRRIESFFDIKGETVKLAHMPACAALFLRGDVAPAQKTLLAPLSREAERRQLHETLNAWTLTSANFGVDPRWSLLHGVALDLKADSAALPKLPKRDDKTAVYASDTGQLRWDLSQPGAGYFIADTLRTRVFTGFVRGRTFQLGDVSLRIGATRLDWATISMTAMDSPASATDQPRRILIAATGMQQNTGLKLERLEGTRVTLRRNWGSEPLLCEGIPAEIVLPVSAGRVQFYPLDESGNRRAAVPVAEQDGKAKLVLSPAHKTVWYEATIR